MMKYLILNVFNTTKDSRTDIFMQMLDKATSGLNPKDFE